MVSVAGGAAGGGVAGGGGARRGVSLRTRHKAYATREYGSCTFHYAHDFVRFDTMPNGVEWPTGQPGARGKHAGGMRRVLVPLTLAIAPSHRQQAAMPRPHAGRGPAAQPARSWQLDTLAGVHHMSDRVVNGPRKGGNEQYFARFREDELIRCVPPSASPSRTK